MKKEIVSMARGHIKGDMIIYDRTKSDRWVRVIIIDKAAELAVNLPQTSYKYYYTVSDKEIMRNKMNEVL